MSDEKLETAKYLPDRQTALDSVGHNLIRAADYKSAYSYTYSTENNPDSSVSARRLWQVIRRRKWLIATLVFIVTSITAVVMYQIESTYEASTMIEIDEQTTLMRSDSAASSDPQNFSFHLNTKKLMLKSRPVLEDVIVELKLNENPNFIAERNSLWKNVKTMGGLLKAQDRNNARTTPGITRAAQSPKEPIRSPENVSLTKAVKSLEDDLTVEQIRDSRVLKVAFSHTDPTIAGAVANTISQKFIQRNFQSKAEKFASAADWLARSTEKLRDKAKQAEVSLANYVREHKIFSVPENGEKGTLTTEKLTALHDQVMRIETDRTLKGSLYSEVKAGRIAQLPETFADPKMLNLQKGLDELNTLAAQLSTKYGPENPRVKEVKQQINVTMGQIDASRKMLEAKLQTDYERAQRDEQVFKGALTRAKREAVNENQESIQYNILKQEVETANSIYKDFMQKSNQANVQLAEQYNDIRVIEPAQVPTNPSGPKRLLVILVGFFLGSTASVGFALFLESLDNTIRNYDDVDRYVQLPALGIIPAMTASKLRLRSAKMIGGSAGNGLLNLNGALRPDKVNGDLRPELLFNVDAFSPYAEAYRQLRTSVLRSTAGRMVRTLLITSSLPDEGKTTTAVNLAMSLAQTGASVLLIDADLRRPSLHTLFQVDHRRGLSTLLSDQTAYFDLTGNPETESYGSSTLLSDQTAYSLKGLAIIEQWKDSNLYLLTSGPAPPNPAELLGSEQMQRLLTSLKSTYTYIIIDSPPIAPFTDGVLMSSMVDGVLLVVHGGKISRDVVRRTRKMLDEVGARILGIVLNNVNPILQDYDYDPRYYQQSYSDTETEADHHASEQFVS